MKTFLLYCRSYYESELASEIDYSLGKKNAYGFSKLQKGDAYLEYTMQSKGDFLPFSSLIFARQKIELIDSLDFSETNDRVAEVLKAFQGENYTFGDVYVEYADSESGKEVAKFCKKFVVPLRSALRKKGLLTKQRDESKDFLHLFFKESSACKLGISNAGDRCLDFMGIKRFKMPSDAPSRSTLKLEDAIRSFLNEEQQSLLFCKGMTAVDLGACPGGWTYQLVKRGLHVEAIDNGMIDDGLMATGKVEHYQEDGFAYKPRHGHVDWIVCDMIEKPDKVAELMIQWLTKRMASAAIFNLKLPMKKRFATLLTLLEKIKSDIKPHAQINLQCKHLYHDRDEVTVMVVLNPSLYALKESAQI